MTPASPVPSRSLRGLLGRAALRNGAGVPPARGFAASASLPAQDEDSEPMAPGNKAERRRALAGQIAMELLQRPDLRQAPEVVQDFLLQVWPLVMAQVRLDDAPWEGADHGGTDREDAVPGGGVDVVTILLWTVRRDAILRRPARLVALVPSLLAQLRQGLALLGREPQQDQAFFDALEALHQPALQLLATRRQAHNIC